MSKTNTFLMLLLTIMLSYYVLTKAYDNNVNIKKHFQLQAAFIVSLINTVHGLHLDFENLKIILLLG